MEFLLPLLNPNAFQGQQAFGDFGIDNDHVYPGFGFAPRCGRGPAQHQSCSSQQARTRQAGEAEQKQQQQWPQFDPAALGFNLEDFLSTAAAFVASLADVQAQNQSSSTPEAKKATNVPKSASALNSNGFQIKFDVAQFKPEELTVQVVDNFIVLEGGHEEHEDEHGFVSRKFTRRIPIPAGIDAEGVSCSFTTAGQLVISAPKLVQAPSPVPTEADTDASAGEKSIPIQQVNGENGQNEPSA